MRHPRKIVARMCFGEKIGDRDVVGDAGKRVFRKHGVERETLDKDIRSDLNEAVGIRVLDSFERNERTAAPLDRTGFVVRAMDSFPPHGSVMESSVDRPDEKEIVNEESQDQFDDEALKGGRLYGQRRFGDENVERRYRRKVRHERQPRSKQALRTKLACPFERGDRHSSVDAKLFDAIIPRFFGGPKEEMSRGPENDCQDETERCRQRFEHAIVGQRPRVDGCPDAADEVV